jgi:hypothetical protein
VIALKACTECVTFERREFRRCQACPQINKTAITMCGAKHGVIDDRQVVFSGELCEASVPNSSRLPFSQTMRICRRNSSNRCSFLVTSVPKNLVSEEAIRTALTRVLTAASCSVNSIRLQRFLGEISRLRCWKIDRIVNWRVKLPGNR